MSVKRWRVTFREELNDVEIAVKIYDEASDYAVDRARKRLDEVAPMGRTPYYYDLVSVEQIGSRKKR